MVQWLPSLLHYKIRLLTLNGGGGGRCYCVVLCNFVTEQFLDDPSVGEGETQSVCRYVQPGLMDVNFLILQDRDEVVTLADEDENVAGIHRVVLHHIHDEEQVAPVMVESGQSSQPPVLHWPGVAVSSSQGLLHSGGLGHLSHLHHPTYLKLIGSAIQTQTLGLGFTRQQHATLTPQFQPIC